MELSANAARALEQVNLGLAILYGANYFTEEEWTKIDSLIRKKQHGSTPAPPCHILDDDVPMMSFENFAHNSHVNIQDASVGASKKGAITISEKEIPAPVHPELAELAQTPAEGLIESSTDLCLDDLLGPLEPARQVLHLRPTETSHTSGISQAETLHQDFESGQHDSIMIPDVGIPKDGRDSIWGLDSAESFGGEMRQPDLASASEMELWTPSSVTDVDSDDIPSPAHGKGWNQPHPETPVADVIKGNEKPKAKDDSREANKLSRSTKTLSDSVFARDGSSGEDGPAPTDELTLGEIFVAQCSLPKSSGIQIDVRSGDSIKVLKKVSGITYHGINLRTKMSGQFLSSILQKLPKERKKYPTVERSRATAARKVSARDTSVSKSSVGDELDKVEDLNAAEWDKDDASVVTASVTINSSTRESVQGRQSAFTNLDDQSQCSEGTTQETLRSMMSKMLDEKLQNLQRPGRKATSSNRVSSCHSEVRNSWMEPLKSVIPKSQVCWFFATPNKECRFTAEECRDLHELLPSSPGDSLNLRMGKPTWGALSDHLSSPISGQSLFDLKGRGKTCWYWANSTCEYSADSCRFLHNHTPAGVMNRPWQKTDRWRQERTMDSGLAEIQEASRGEWGNGAEAEDWIDQEAAESEAADNTTEKYKPPHIKALEERQQVQLAGW